MNVWMVLVGALLPGQAASQPAGVAKIQSVWDFVVKGGPVMVPIGLCSIVALSVIVERLVSLRRHKVIPPAFLPGLKAMLKDGPAARDKAVGYCRENGSPVAMIFMAGIKAQGEPIELMEKHVQEAGQREVFKLRRFLRMLSAVASISTLLGLLGTILGLIEAFQNVAASGEALGKTELLAKGIYEAMITTAAGLIVAIPVIISYHWIAARIEALVAELDREALEFVEEYAASRKNETTPFMAVDAAPPPPAQIAAA